jgi:putative endopeptidase
MFGVYSRGLFGAISSMYVRKYAHPNLRPRVKEMVKSIRNVIRNNVLNLDWMDNNTKQNALKKLDAMKQMIAFNEELTNKTLIDSFFASRVTIP